MDGKVSGSGAAPRGEVGSIAVDADGVVRDCDEVFARSLGRTREQVVGSRLADLVAPDVAALRGREALLEQVESLVASLQEAIDSRDEFLSIASHELKTPLTALQLQVDGLLRASARLGGELSPLLRDRLAAIGRQGKRIGQLVADLLDVSRIRGGLLDLKLEPVDLAQVARDAVERFRQQAALAGCELMLETAGPVVGPWDRGRLDQVASNLVSNALKYGKGKPVEVAAWRDGDAALLAVADQGIGIAPEQQDRIFQRFERAASGREFGGL
ncbi:MAG TPA: HAMP domain-containing sensor histidine kinase, partial [Anaeromyxobacteraceae bacterium]